MIRAIVACDPTGIIGIDGKIPWRYPADFKHFKASTMGGVCIMGRKTWESIPVPKNGGPKLPGRHIVILSRKGRIHAIGDDSSVMVEFTIHRGIETAQSAGGGNLDIWICGGGEIYAEAARLDIVDEWEVTRVPEVDVPEGAQVTRVFWKKPGVWEPLHEHFDQPEGFLEAGLERLTWRKITTATKQGD